MSPREASSNHAERPATTDRLYASVVTLRAQRDGVVPATQGHHAHAAFLALVRQVDPDLAAVLHGGSDRKPFTVGPLDGLPPAHRLPSPRRGGAGGLSRVGFSPEAPDVNVWAERAKPVGLKTRPPKGAWPSQPDGLPSGIPGDPENLPLTGAGGGVGVSVRAGQSATLRFTFLDAGLFNVFIRRFLEGDARPTIRLGPVDWLVEQVLTTPGSQPWAGYTSWAELWDRWQDVELPRTITFEFASPTGFNRTTARVKQLTDPYPSPRQVFGSLARAWRAFSPGPALPPDLEAYADETVGVARYQLETHMHEFRPGRRQIGSTGVVAYELLDQNDEAGRRALHVLADFAFYAGVGYKTTQGLGQCRRIER